LDYSLSVLRSFWVLRMIRLCKAGSLLGWWVGGSGWGFWFFVGCIVWFYGGVLFVVCVLCSDFGVCLGWWTLHEACVLSCCVSGVRSLHSVWLW